MPAPNKYLSLDPVSGGHKETNAPGVSAGGASSGYLPSLNPQGQLDISFMPPQLGVQSAIVQASEAIAADALVNVYDTGAPVGTFRVRNADAAGNKPATGFVTGAVASGANATVFADGVITGLSGLSAGKYFLGAVGVATQTLPSGAGTLLQSVGYALSATQLMFQPGAGVVLA